MNEKEEVDEDLFIADEKGNQIRLPDHVKIDDGKTTRVGWLFLLQEDIIYHACYGKDDIKPQCNLKLHQLDKVVVICEALSADDKARLPATDYNDTKAYLTFIASQKNETTSDQKPDPKKLSEDSLTR